MSIKMDYLLDTNAFIWVASAPQHLPPQVKRLCADLNNTLVVSVASIWEIQTKVALGSVKLHSVFPISDDVALQQIITDQQTNGVTFHPITLQHVRQMATLPWHHKDPFDRIILGTAISDGFVLLSSDTAFPQYRSAGLTLFWQ